MHMPHSVLARVTGYPKDPPAPRHPSLADAALIQAMAEQLVQQAQQLGLSIEIQHRPQLPPAMGNSTPVITVWHARGHGDNT